MQLGGKHGTRPRPEIVGAFHEGGGAGLDDRFALTDERKDLDVVAESLELEDLVEHEGLGRLREPRHQIGQAERRCGRGCADRCIRRLTRGHRAAAGRPASSAYSAA